MNENIKKTKEDIIRDIQKMSGKDFIEYLKTNILSDIHIIVRDYMTMQQKKEINSDEETKKIFKDITKQAKESFEFDCKTATIRDVKQGVSEVYQKLFTSINNLNNSINQINNEIKQIELKIDNIINDSNKNLNLICEEHTDSIS